MFALRAQWPTFMCLTDEPICGATSRALVAITWQALRIYKGKKRHSAQQIRPLFALKLRHYETAQE